MFHFALLDVGGFKLFANLS